METAIISNYVKDEDGKNLGLIVAALIDEKTFNIDYSMIHYFEEKKFDKNLANQIAVNRTLQARKNRVKMRIMNYDILHAYMDMIARSFRYFKDCEPSEKVKWIMEKYNFKNFGRSYSYTTNPNNVEPRYVEYD